MSEINAQELDGFFWGMSALSFLMSFAIGSNETDALSTAFSSGALSLVQSLILGSVFEFIGAYLCSKQVSTTLSEKIILRLSEESDSDIKKMMVAVTICAFAFTTLSTMMGMPISGTHTMVAAFIGAGIAGVGAGNVNSAQILQIVIQSIQLLLLHQFLSFIIFQDLSVDY